MFGVCAENSVSNTVLVTAEQCLHSIKAFSASHPTSKWAGGAQEAGRGRGGDS